MTLPGAPGFGSSRSIPSGPAGHEQRKYWADKKDKTLQEEMEGWLACLGVGSRTARYIPKEAVQAQVDGKIADARMHSSVVTLQHGPYLDDWSKVPPDIAAKYNTGPPK
ncbi:hypothetical protein AB1Y20_018267 [Prymnesium parvum]|uniref:Uncharacterized protein n=1 Tax=Prymnesium parvum TaxID=97485 RepID=A0AB34JRH5_PRYPA|mmetsp:Transcript_15927/g.39938  ORF Transcript_15927/g.39938 Transcript_15927/m.39938 type:complete len:109 (-) Transcript_15927:379-705(-)|eukprot:CAMPEP_0182822488 /NCGR_PEP_ID=MMETSP0006_2-20121128/14240_1 /TAXON_ID=97485 /ORGANISM="Prymnesium parvum, Strain Texoma1" /LENGTH=108 /DNA_ID=CAMNT_0024949335 /DNA_START=126 /DNA_END=452 /DNA_ORIENTATION=+